MHKRFALFPLLLILASCAASSGGGPRRSARTLFADEITEAGVITAAGAIEQLRPQWLNTRSTPTANNPDGSPPTLYLDGIRMDSIRELERIRASRVEEMRFLSPTDATNRYGTGHTGGAILVTTH
jgi:hypothetical protein